MKKVFLVAIILFGFAGTSLACGCGCNGKASFAASNNQKACQNVFSLITIDFSFLSPRATAADVNVGMPKPCMKWWHKCCPPSCPAPCMPQCSPCVPQGCPKCNTQSMTPECDDEAMLPTLRDKQGEIIPVANMQECNKPNVVSVTKTRLFKIDFFHHSKI